MIDMAKRVKQFFKGLDKRGGFVLFFLFCFYALVFFLLLQNSFGYLDPDFGWHLASGRNSLESKTLPSANYYNYTLAEEEWINHEWLSDIIVYIIYNKAGYLALSILFALLIVSVLGILHRFTRKHYNEKSSLLLTLFLILWGVLAIRPHSGVRMQEVTLFFLVSLLGVLFFYSRKRDRKILWLLLPLMYLWACLHGGFLLGVFLLFAFGIVKVAEAVIAGRYKPFFLYKQEVLNYKEIKSYLFFSLAAVFSTFFTPYGIKLYSFLSGYSDTFYLTHIEEWLPQYFLPFNYFQITYIALVASVVLFYFYYGLSRQKHEYKINIWEAFLLIFFILISIKSRRHFPLLFAGSLPLVAGFLSDFLNVKTESYLHKLSFWLKIYLISCLTVSTAFIAVKTDFTTSPFDHYCRKYPCRAVDFLKSNPGYKDLNLLAEYGWGGYLIWQYPEGCLFIDGRMPQHQINDSTILEEYYGFFDDDKENIKRQLNEYNVEMILVESNPGTLKPDAVERFMIGTKKENIESKTKKLIDYLSKNKEWEKVFESEVSIIYKKE
jgi:hypothetical protein